ncbi:MAG: dihydrofolate reductase family protein [Phormidesmis sp.]
MANYVYIATSLDGFIATNDGGLDWLFEIPNPDGSDYGYAEFMHKIDAVVMGRHTFEKVLAFDAWPYAKPVFVLSNRLMGLSENITDKAELVRGALKPLVSQLNHRGYHNLYIDGGRTIQGFLKEDLIDEMIITRVPILLGSGLPLFEGLDQPLHFTHQQTEVYNNSLVKSCYIRNK